MTQTHHDGTHTDKVYVRRFLVKADISLFISPSQRQANRYQSRKWEKENYLNSNKKASINPQGWWLLFYSYMSAQMSQTTHVSYSFGFRDIYVKYAADA